MPQHTNLVFTDLFEETCEREFQIGKKQVRRAIDSPDSQQVEEFNGLVLGFFVKRESQPKAKSYLLVCARRQNDTWLVDLAFRILPDLLDEAKTLGPIEFLQQLAARFGLELQIGAYRSKFVFRESIQCPSQELDPINLVEVLSPANQGLLYPIMKVVTLP